jgi:hypothetical protein
VAVVLILAAVALEVIALQLLENLLAVALLLSPQ